MRGRALVPLRATRGTAAVRPPLARGVGAMRASALRPVWCLPVWGTCGSSFVGSLGLSPPDPAAQTEHSSIRWPFYNSFTVVSLVRLSSVIAPRDREFFDLFEEAGGNILRAADLLDRMLRVFPDRGGDLARDILICEQDGDRITHDIIRRLNETFVTPIDREDIYELASALDDIVDYTEEVADYLGLYKIEAPMEQAQRLAHVLLECAPPDRRGHAAPARLQGHQPLHGRDQPARERRRPHHARGDRRRCSTTGSTRWS